MLLIYISEQGAYVTALYNSSRSEIDANPDLVQYETSETPRLSCVSVDATDEASVERFFTSGMKKDWPVLSVLVVNHGIFVAQDCPIWDMSLAQFERTLKVNTVGPFLLIRSFLKTYKSTLDSSEPTIDLYPPTIVLIGSTAAEFGEANHSDYATSKSGLTHGMMKSVKNEIVKVHPRGRINTVAPGWVGTKMAEESLKDERTRFMAMAT
jgi:NAD(P)-dependent dehydrogenase (short-subunit alcohol dehydrogenase family)